MSIEGFRWALLGKQSPDFPVTAVSAAVVLRLLARIIYFKRMEHTFADVVLMNDMAIWVQNLLDTTN